jgi:hypothetical protein
MRSPVVDLLADLAGALDEARVEWYLFGAQAAILHGVARLTADVDVTVRLPAAMPNQSLVAVLQEHRFKARFDDPAFVERTRVIPLVHIPTSMPLDAVLAGPGIEDRFFDRAQTREVEGVRVRVASAEDLVVMKILAGRPKDLDDVRAMLAAHAGAIDAEYIRSTLAILEAALAQSDLLPAFEQGLASAGRQDRG